MQSPEELASALAEPAISHIQMPVNILDDRWDELVPEIQRVRSTRELVIHARSALLQGLLVSDDASKWKRAHVDDPMEARRWIVDAAAAYTGGDSVGLCLNLVRSLDWVDGVVVGMDDIEQLKANLQVFSGPALSAEAQRALSETRPTIPRATLNPASWCME